MQPLLNKEFFDPDFYKFMLREYESIRVRRKSFKGKPDAFDRVNFDLDKMFEAFYRKFLD